MMQDNMCADKDMLWINSNVNLEKMCIFVYLSWKLALFCSISEGDKLVRNCDLPYPPPQMSGDCGQD